MLKILAITFKVAYIAKKNGITLTNKTMPEKKELSGSEALYGFCGWLTTRKEETVMGSANDCAPIVQLITEFCEANNLTPPNEEWHKSLVHPKA